MVILDRIQIEGLIDLSVAGPAIKTAYITAPDIAVAGVVFDVSRDQIGLLRERKPFAIWTCFVVEKMKKLVCDGKPTVPQVRN